MTTNARQGVLLLNFIVLFISLSSGSKVLELSDRFLDVRENGLWLVKFYAPWCGHCKKLEPIWNQVAQDLHYSSVRVGRVDCTRFSSVATAFDIRFPTILFLKGSKTFSYNGDRTREEIVKFALRLEGSAVRQLSNVDEVDEAKQNHDVFFLMVTKSLNDADPLWLAYNYVAEQFQTSCYFYSLILESLPEKKPSLNLLAGHSNSPSGIYVFKDNMVYKFSNFSDDVTALNTSLTQWLLQERFPLFVKVTQGTFPILLKTEKYLVIAVLEENLIEKLTPEMEEFRNIIKSVANEHLAELKDHFVFGWAPQTTIASSVAMQHLEAPSLLVVNSQTYQYYLPEVAPSEMTEEIVVTFLRGILNNNERAHGGNGIFSRIYRVYFDVTTTVFEMWAGNPVLTAVLFGLPLGFLSLICYSICCADILDASDDEDSTELDDSHEKKE